MTAGRSILPALDIPTRLLAASLGGLLLSLLAMLFMGDHILLQVLVILFFGLMHLALLIRSPGMFAFYFQVFFSGFGMLVANAILAASSFYIIEADYTSYDIGAQPLLIVSLTIFFLVYAAITWNFDKPMTARRPISRREAWITIVISAVPIAVCYLAFLIYGSPWFAGSSRSAFWALGGIPQMFFSLGFNRLGPSALLTGVVYFLAERRMQKRACIILLVLNIMALILFGGRAGAVVSPTLLFLLPLAFGHGKLKPSQTWRILLFGGIGAAGVAVVALASYAFQFASTTGQSQGALIGAFTRIVLQGHVWWNIYYTTTISHIGDTGSSFWNEIKGFFAWAPGKTGRGSDLVMRLIAPKILYEGAVEQDIAFAGGWPALGLYYFGPYLLQIVQALLALLYGGTALLLKRDLLRGHYVSAMILFFIWWQLLAEVVLNANWYLLLNIRTAVFLALYFILQRRTPHLRRFVMKMMTLPASSQQRNDATS